MNLPTLPTNAPTWLQWAGWLVAFVLVFVLAYIKATKEWRDSARSAMEIQRVKLDLIREESERQGGYLRVIAAALAADVTPSQRAVGHLRSSHDVGDQLTARHLEARQRAREMLPAVTSKLEQMLEGVRATAGASGHRGTLA